MTHKELFEKLKGKWKGQVKTWFEPGKLADDSQIEGEFSDVINDNFIRHTYTGSIKGKPRTG